MTTTAEVRSQTLYRFLDAEGALLYVGISVRPWDRWKQHRGEKSWWEEVASVTLQQFATRDDVLVAEREAIRSESPRYNIQHRLDTYPGQVGGSPECDPEWDGVHAPQIFFRDDLLYCSCSPPNYDSEPDDRDYGTRPHNPADYARYEAACEQWLAAQSLYHPEEYSAHVIRAVLGERFRVERLDGEE